MKNAHFIRTIAINHSPNISKIGRLILNAAKNGLFSIVVSLSLRKEDINYMLSKGYKVDTQICEDGSTYYTIKW